MGEKSKLSALLLSLVLLASIATPYAAHADTDKDEKKKQKAEDKANKTEEKSCKKIQKIADKLTKKGLSVPESIQTKLNQCTNPGGLEQIIEELMDQISDLLVSIGILEEENDSLHQQIIELEQQKLELEQQVQSLENENSNLNSQIEELNAIIEELMAGNQDSDNDGFTSDVDCDDANPAINPDATDIPGNGIDENCDGVDAVFPDNDNDGFTSNVDCDDANPAVNPATTEILGNHIDDNCDGQVDQFSTNWVINEVDTNNVGIDYSEFIELYNPNSFTISANFFSIQLFGNDCSLYAEYDLFGNIPAGGFLVLGNTALAGTVDPNFFVPMQDENSIFNTNGIIRLVDDSGNHIDSLEYGLTACSYGEGSPTTADTESSVIGRYPDGHDTNNNVVDFVQIQFPTPGGPNMSP